MKQPFFQSNPSESSSSNPFSNPWSDPWSNPSRLALSHLLQLCVQSGDEPLWSEFIRRTQPVIAGVIIKTLRRWRSGSLNVVDDLVQETYLKLCANDFKALREFDCQHEHAFFGFLKVVASNVVHDHSRGSYSQKRGSGREEEQLGPLNYADAGASAERMEREILLQEISECLEARASGPNFSRDYVIFWLYYVLGYTAKAISRLPSIGLGAKGVESTLLRLTRLVRKDSRARTRHMMTNTHKGKQ
jgi:RNA polymerase sigma-70 factor (ECF subfamily)